MKNADQDLMGRSKRKLDVLFSFGANRELDASLTKLVHFQIAKYHTMLKKTETELSQFETMYEMSSANFHKKFEDGEIGDEADFFEWVGLYENYLLYKDRICSLKETLKSD